MIRVLIETHEGYAEIVGKEETDTVTWPEILELVDRAIKGLGYNPPKGTVLHYIGENDLNG